MAIELVNRETLDAVTYTGEAFQRVGQQDILPQSITPTHLTYGDEDGNIVIRDGAELRFEDDSGSPYIGFTAPASLTANTTFTLPDGDGTADQVLETDGAGTLSWTAVSTASAPTTITVADGDNKDALTINQNDVTYSKKGIVLNHTTAGYGLHINHSSSTGVPVRIDCTTSVPAIQISCGSGGAGAGLAVAAGATLTGYALYAHSTGGAGNVAHFNSGGTGTTLVVGNTSAGSNLAQQIIHRGADGSAGFKFGNLAGGGVFEIYRKDVVEADIVLKIGRDYLWFDTNRDLRTHSSMPTSDTDGTIVGTQS